MKFEGKIDLDVPAGKAWDFLVDVKRFSSCLPGLEEIKQIDERTFDGVIGAAVGPISGKFSFRSTLVESHPPREMIVRTEGTDSVTKSTVNADMTVALDGSLDSKTRLDYRVDAQINGRLAILGDMILRTTATLILEEFARRLRRGLGNKAAV